MRSRRRAWIALLGKEWRDLLAARAWWVLLLAMGPLVGFAFIGSVWTYAEASGLNGSAAGVGEAFSPLVGVWAPTFSACELAAVFLLPFVAIRLVSGDRQSGALKLELQQPLPSAVSVGTKALVLMVGWLLASLPAAVAVALWLGYGGALHVPELIAVMLGHVLNAGLTIAVACAMAAFAEHPSTAAILTLSVTVGTWILDFVAAVNGGWWARAANYTPTAMVAEYQHGLVRLDTAIVAVTVTALGLAAAAIWRRIGVPARRRAIESAVAVAVATVVAAAAAFVTPSWDLSENRMNSFARADEAALRRIHGPLRLEVHLAPEDPRRFDLDYRVLKKLRRVMPDLQVRYESATSIGLFEQTRPHYGEVWYELGGRRVMSRVTTPEGALEAIYGLSNVEPVGAPGADDEFRGHPLAVPPKGAAIVFYGLWPVITCAAAAWVRRRHA